MGHVQQQISVEWNILTIYGECGSLHLSHGIGRLAHAVVGTGQWERRAVRRHLLFFSSLQTRRLWIQIPLWNGNKHRVTRVHMLIWSWWTAEQRPYLADTPPSWGLKCHYGQTEARLRADEYNLINWKSFIYTEKQPVQDLL